MKKGVGKLMNSGPRRASANGGGGEGGGDGAGDARGVVGVVKEEGLLRWWGGGCGGGVVWGGGCQLKKLSKNLEFGKLFRTE